jgi:putative glutamine amidotransferase
MKMKKDTIIIGITDCSRYENYHKWIEREPGIEVIKLSPDDNNLSDIDKCDGVILSGGEDVHPRLYAKPEYLELCHEIDEKRDAFEWKVMERTEKNRLPLLGICRGLQVANVFFGGTLIPHIPAFGKFDHSKAGSEDRYHPVQVDPNSQLKDIVQSFSGEVNSAHHQAADRIGRGLVANALSGDGIIEGIERENAAEHPFLQLVQWHPERMTNEGSAFSRNIKQKFIEACKKSKM